MVDREVVDTTKPPHIPMQTTWPWQKFIKNVKKETGLYALTLNTLFEVSGNQ
jgi:hypothetical protein